MALVKLNRAHTAHASWPHDCSVALRTLLPDDATFHEGLCPHNRGGRCVVDILEVAKSVHFRDVVFFRCYERFASTFAWRRISGRNERDDVVDSSNAISGSLELCFDAHSCGHRTLGTGIDQMKHWGIRAIKSDERETKGVIEGVQVGGFRNPCPRGHGAFRPNANPIGSAISRGIGVVFERWSNDPTAGAHTNDLALYQRRTKRAERRTQRPCEWERQVEDKLLGSVSHLLPFLFFRLLRHQSK